MRQTRWSFDPAAPGTKHPLLRFGDTAGGADAGEMTRWSVAQGARRAESRNRLGELKAGAKALEFMRTLSDGTRILWGIGGVCQRVGQDTLSEIRQPLEII